MSWPRLALQLINSICKHCFPLIGLLSMADGSAIAADSRNVASPSHKGTLSLLGKRRHEDIKRGHEDILAFQDCRIIVFFGTRRNVSFCKVSLSNDMAVLNVLF